jgi:tRNA U34 5-methylaminomethyl-2-thiouridine-forming methyltransferase MnmC
MEKWMTKDGSQTFYNREYGDYYHSTAGAASEAKIKYIRPCRISELASMGEVQVLDIGFGLGYNLAAAIDAVQEARGRISAVSLEKHEEMLSCLGQVEPQFTCYPVIRQLALDKSYTDSDCSLKLVIGDAVDTIRTLQPGFDAVFHDPFAPTRNPELWTESFFRDVKKLMKPGAILATYSCARHVRDNLRAAGFTVKDGPVFGRRGPSTVAMA